jgi:hypothetical protein
MSATTLACPANRGRFLGAIRQRIAGCASPPHHRRALRVCRTARSASGQKPSPRRPGSSRQHRGDPSLRLIMFGHGISAAARRGASPPPGSGGEWFLHRGRWRRSRTRSASGRPRSTTTPSSRG